jgi:flagellar hook-associated protein 3 FlgL
MRISTADIFAQGVNALQLRQSELARTQKQLATGNRLLAAQDDPVAASLGVSLDRATAALEQFGKNAQSVRHRLGLQESAVTSVNDRLTRIRELAVQANSGSQSAESRSAIVAELRQHYDAMLAEANVGDGNGRFLFGGTQDGSPPFVAAGAAVVYVGDQVQRRIEISPELNVADVDPGSEVLVRVRTGRDGVAMRADPANSGTAVLQSSGVVDSSLWDGDSYRVRFNAGNYDVLDSSNTIIASAAFVAGQSISFRGVQLTVGGVPADGDVYTVAPAPTRDLFASVDELINTLQSPNQTPAQRAAIQNRIYASIEDLGTAQGHMIDQRTTVGARMATIDTSADEREAQTLEHRTLVSELRDLDYAEAASRMSLQLTALEAAQASFVRVQSLSLFQMLR